MKCLKNLLSKEVYTESEEPVGEETTVTESAVYMTDSEVADTTTSNGNTAGTVGTAAAAQMAAATGVPQSTWEAIIARESNGDPNVTNASGGIRVIPNNAWLGINSNCSRSDYGCYKRL